MRLSSRGALRLSCHHFATEIDSTRRYVTAPDGPVSPVQRLARTTSMAAAASRCMSGVTWLYVSRGDRDGGMPQPLTDNLRMDARLQQQRRGGVAEVVEPQQSHA